MLKANGNNIIRWLMHIINEIWHSENLPEDWTRGIILPFWKRKCDKLVCRNNRGITLLSIRGKVFARVLLSRSLPAIRCYRQSHQAGFMPNRSTIDHIAALRLIIEKPPEFRKGRHLYIAFIDLKTAFDSVDHASLWAILACIGVPSKILRLFKKLYGDLESCIRINGKLSEWFNINSSVRQGCVAAEHLFILCHRFAHRSLPCLSVTSILLISNTLTTPFCCPMISTNSRLPFQFTIANHVNWA